MIENLIKYYGFQHASDIIEERREHPNDAFRQALRRQKFWTADSALYRVEDGEVILYFGSRSDNLIFKNIHKAIDRFGLLNERYLPSKKDLKTVIDSDSILRINLSELNLEGSSWNEWMYFDIYTADSAGSRLNPMQKAFAARVYGDMLKADEAEYITDFEKNMKMLADEGINITKIIVLGPDYVRKNVKKDSAIVRTCWLNSCVPIGSSFCVNGKNIDSNVYQVLSELLKVAEDDNTQKSWLTKLLRKFRGLPKR